MKKQRKIKKVLLLGSGALKIGEAGEFDYSGSQAIKALKEEGIKVVLANPNIATIQTSEMLADEIYFLPIAPFFVEKIIKKEKPDGILLSFGGQTALNCGLALEKGGVLRKHGVQILGTPIAAIELTEDRQKFADHLTRIGVPIVRGRAANNLPEAIAIAARIDYPVMVRAAFSLGGQKSGVAFGENQLREIAGDALSVSPQVLVEKYLHHFKEVEYEVVRDRYDNCVAVCNMENFDPLGVHTGDSIVVAPSQTLDNFEYHALRQASIRIVKSLGIVGECNVQFALNPRPKNGKIDFQVIEVNARLSRSSALASKATGYPLAYVAAKLALGRALFEVRNQVTRTTQSFFEPALDYIVVKIPRWDLEKFRGAEEQIGSAMKSVGEVMAIGRSFEEALQKAVRMQTGAAEGVTDNGLPSGKEALEYFLKIPTPKRLFAIAEALGRKVPVEKIYRLSGIDPWFLERIKNITDAEREFAKKPVLKKPTLEKLKMLGFSDKKIGGLSGKTEFEIRKIRKSFGIKPFVFQIDTLAGEVPAKTNYLYLTYHGKHNDVGPLGKKGIVVLGSGPYHIGSSVEFDWSCVFAALALRKYGRESIIVNCNPETVSTDYDMSDRLYFENVSFETVADIYEFENPEGIVISVGGQRPNNLAKKLFKEGFFIFGTSAMDIDRAENRSKFSALLDKLRIPQPVWNSFSDFAEAKKFADEVGYPVLVRPSYVLSGSAMSVCFSEVQLESFARKAILVNQDYPVTISKFMTEALELEFDAIAQRGNIVISAIAEHVEYAGVHSGDATVVFPAPRVSENMERKIMLTVKKIARELAVTGPFNIQFLVKNGEIFVIEVNLRASRTFPLLSKAIGVNFPAIGVDAFFGKAKKINYGKRKSFVVKSPQFSFARLTGADPVLHVEMSSTGEVACFGKNEEEALLKSILSTLPLTFNKAALLSLGGEYNKKGFTHSAMVLAKHGYELFATEGTAEHLRAHGVRCKKLFKIHEGSPNVLSVIENKKIDFVINLSDRSSTKKHALVEKQVTDGYRIRRATVDRHVGLFTDLKLAEAFVRAIASHKPEDLQIKSYKEHVH